MSEAMRLTWFQRRVGRGEGLRHPIAASLATVAAQAIKGSVKDFNEIGCSVSIEVLEKACIAGARLSVEQNELVVDGLLIALQLVEGKLEVADCLLGW